MGDGAQLGEYVDLVGNKDDSRKYLAARKGKLRVLLVGAESQYLWSAVESTRMTCKRSLLRFLENSPETLRTSRSRTLGQSESVGVAAPGGAE